MKNLIILSFLIFSFSSVFSQVAINTSGNPPDGSAMLDISAANKGILIPRMADPTVISGPATGLMVYNTSTNSFWYYNGSAWTQIAAGGGSGTLDEAYDWGGAGAGRIITADAGAVEINNGSNAAHFINSSDVANFTNGSDVVSLVTTGNSVATITTSSKERALTLTNSNATSYGLYAENSNTGVAIYGEVTNTSNQYSAIEGVANYGTTTAGVYPSGVSGYFDGSGMGVGVWGETNGNGTSAGAGIYGNATNNNFGVKAYSKDYPGLDVSTGSTSQAMQVYSNGPSYTNPAFYSIGTLQFDVSSSSAPAVHINSIGGGEPSVTPSLGDYGYVGTSTYYWYRIYVDNLYYKNAYNFKKAPIPLDDTLNELIISDIDKITPVFFQPNKTTSQIIEGKEYFFQPNLELGLKIDELPDYLLDNSFSMISISGLATLSLAGVKYNHTEIQKLKQTISDFGIVEMNSNEKWVNFNDDFSSKLSDNNTPTVTLTANKPDVTLYISEQTNKGFKIVVEGNPENLKINWIAMAKVDAQNEQSNFQQKISPEIYQKLRVPQKIKEKAIKIHQEPAQQPTIKLIGNGSTTPPKNKRE